MIGDDDWNDVYSCPTKAIMIDRRKNSMDFEHQTINLLEQIIDIINTKS